MIQIVRFTIRLGQRELKTVDGRKTLNFDEFRLQAAISVPHESKIRLNKQRMLGFIRHPELGRVWQRQRPSGTQD